MGKYEREATYMPFPHSDRHFSDEMELGARVAGSIYRENTGMDYFRMMIITTRGD